MNNNFIRLHYFGEFLKAIQIFSKWWIKIESIVQKKEPENKGARKNKIYLSQI